MVPKRDKAWCDELERLEPENGVFAVRRGKGRIPWHASDAQVHTKAADTPGKQKRWAEVANRALAECEAAKGNNCEMQAIKQANAAMGREETVE